MDWASASEIAEAVEEGRRSALSVTEAALARIASLNPTLNAFTDVTADRARAKARALDRARSEGKPLGPLAGVPFAVKNLFDIEGLPTRAGSKINRRHKPAVRDATLIERLEAAGAVLLGGLNMGEYAYDFTGENVHDGPSRNPHDLSRMTGGSSGGSGGAVAGGLVPLALGSDTNGSIRVPSSFCGIFGLKPTYGRLSRARTFPFVASLDHLGPFARNVRDLALAYDAMQGNDPDDPVCAGRPAEVVAPQLDRAVTGIRIAVAGGYFRKGVFAEASRAVEQVAKALDVRREVEIPEAECARSAAYVITAAEGAALHLERLRDARQGLRSGGARPPDRRRGGAGGAGQPGAEVPPLVSRARAGAVPRGRCHHCAGHALHRAEARPADLRARWRRDGAAPQHRHLYPADLFHRPAGGGGAGAVVAAADRRAGHRRAMAGRCCISRCQNVGAFRRRRRAAAKSLRF